MIPLKDINPSYKRPWAVYLIIAVNLLVFFKEIKLGLLSGGAGEAVAPFFYRFGILPARYSTPEIASAFTLYEQSIPFITSLFVHGGVMHLVGNMWMLFIFGDNVEEWLGSVRFFFVYVLFGVLAGALHLLLNWRSTLPVVGASGAIAGVMGVYMLKFPKARVLTLVPIFFFFQFIELPAALFLGLWFLLQVLTGASGQAGNVAWVAHVGGFLAGAALWLYYRGKDISA